MPEIGTPGLMSGDGKRGVGHRPQATAPILDSTVAEVGTRGALPMPSIGSNMNVINISAKRSELDLARRRRHACNIDVLCTTEKAHETCTKDCPCSFRLYVCGIVVLRLV